MVAEPSSGISENGRRVRRAGAADVSRSVVHIVAFRSVIPRTPAATSSTSPIRNGWHFRGCRTRRVPHPRTDDDSTPLMLDEHDLVLVAVLGTKHHRLPLFLDHAVDDVAVRDQSPHGLGQVTCSRSIMRSIAASMSGVTATLILRGGDAGARSVWSVPRCPRRRPHRTWPSPSSRLHVAQARRQGRAASQRARPRRDTPTCADFHRELVHVVCGHDQRVRCVAALHTRFVRVQFCHIECDTVKENQLFRVTLGRTTIALFVPSPGNVPRR